MHGYTHIVAAVDMAVNNIVPKVALSEIFDSFARAVESWYQLSKALCIFVHVLASESVGISSTLCHIVFFNECEAPKISTVPCRLNYIQLV